MTEADVIIRNGKIFTPLGLFDAGISIEGEKIVGIAKDSHLPSAEKVIDAGGNLVIPGGIDEHTHIHNVYGESFRNGTQAAIAGGTTMIVEFTSGNDKKPVMEAFNEKKREGESESSVDFALHTHLWTEKELELIPNLVKEGVFSFKFYMAGAREPISSGFLLEAFKQIKAAGGIASCHPENEEIIKYLTEKVKKSGRSDPMAHVEARPAVGEVEAVARTILFTKEVGGHLQVLHVTSGDAANLIKKSRMEGVHVTAETHPQYLLFTLDDYKKLGPFLQVEPCIRTKRDNEILWRNLAEGYLDFVTTDHYAPMKKDKEKGWENIWEVEGGVPGIETRMMLIMSEGVNKGRISLERFVDACCTAPARVYGLYPKKGAIQIGSDADIVIIDRKKEIKISNDKLHHVSDWTPFEGWTVKGVPTHTIVKGKVMYENGEIYGKPGWGKYLPRNVVKQRV